MTMSISGNNRLSGYGVLNMIKKLIFTAALLAPGVAYGGDPSADLSVQVEPASPPAPPSNGITCAIGPNYIGTIPAGAQAAGYTTCAANYDFTTSAFTNTATWLNCPGQAPANALWFLTYSGSNSSPVCSDATIVNDPITNQPVLKFTFTSTDYNNNHAIIELDSRNPHPAGGPGNTFPLGMYLDLTVRYDATSFANTPGHSLGFNYGIWDFFWNSPDNHQAGNNYIEEDLSENGSPCCAPLISTTREWSASGNVLSFPVPNPVGNVANVPGFSQTSYFTYGQRYTHDTSGNIAICTYGNDTQLSSSYGGGAGCKTGHYVNGGSDAAINGRNNLIFWNPAGVQIGNNCPSGHSCAPTTVQTLYVKSVVIFTCSSWRTTGCAIGTNSSAP
jgi:hypothetical protein